MNFPWKICKICDSCEKKCYKLLSKAIAIFVYGTLYCCLHYIPGIRAKFSGLLLKFSLFYEIEVMCPVVPKASSISVCSLSWMNELGVLNSGSYDLFLYMTSWGCELFRLSVLTTSGFLFYLFLQLWLYKENLGIKWLFNKHINTYTKYWE